MDGYTEKETFGIIKQTSAPEQGVFFQNKKYGGDGKYYRIFTDPSDGQCNECAQMQGVILYGNETEMKSALPPYHPNCRCTYKELDEATYRFLVMQAELQLSGKLADVGKGVYVFDVFGRYGFYPARGATIFGIQDNTLGRVSNKTGRPVGGWILRIDNPDNGSSYRHMNLASEGFDLKHIDPKYIDIETGKLKDPHIAVSDDVFNAAVKANKVGKVLKVGGKAVAVVGVVLDVADIGTAMYEDGGWGENTNIAIGGAAGSWAGAWAGGAVGAKVGLAAGTAIGALFGGVGAAPGAAIGALVGGLIGSVAGAVGGRWVGEQAAELINDEYHRIRYGED